MPCQVSRRSAFSQPRPGTNGFPQAQSASPAHIRHTTHCHPSDGPRRFYVLETPKRPWTQQECARLFEDYFGPFPGICPVCAHEVCMITVSYTHLRAHETPEH